jgi:dTDP-glucose 4,6-dehydratase
MTLMITGGAGFIGSNWLREHLAHGDEAVVNLDALTLAGGARNLAGLQSDARHHFVHGDIRDRALVAALLAEHRPRAVLHFAAETHVDRSIEDAAPFVGSNIEGTFVLLEAARAYWQTLAGEQRSAFRFLHVSTDEVYGSLADGAAPFTEASAYAPNNPYAASKAASDHLVRAWCRTYGLPALITHSVNNHGPGQAADKLIPRLLACALAGEALPIYGDGLQRRDWIDVRDHVAALNTVLAQGSVGEAYVIGAHDERSNLEVAQAVCDTLDQLRPDALGPYRRLIAFVADRPGHDRRYAVDPAKLERATGWRARHRFESALRDTLRALLPAA